MAALRSVLDNEAWASKIAAGGGAAFETSLIDNAGGSDEQVLETMFEGSVTLDQKAGVRGRCDIAFALDSQLDLIPSEPGDLLAPYGNELRVKRGLRYLDGTSELVGVGVFKIDQVLVDDDASVPVVRVVGFDRAITITEARLEAPVVIPAGTLATDAILDLVQEAMPDVVYDFITSSKTTTTITAEEGDDRWALCQSIATSMSCELYFDGDGILILRAIPSAASGEPVAVLSEGEEGVLLGAGRDWNREGGYNRVIATGEQLDDVPPYRGVATDNNPLSPTYYFGPYGKVPYFAANLFVNSNAEAASAAAGILQKQLGTVDRINFGTLVDARLEPSDVVRITRSQTEVDEDHVIDSLVIPLQVETPMTGGTRAAQVIA